MAVLDSGRTAVELRPRPSTATAAMIAKATKGRWLHDRHLFWNSTILSWGPPSDWRFYRKIYRGNIHFFQKGMEPAWLPSMPFGNQGVA